MSKSAQKKKGLSMEEKIIKVEKWFHQHRQPYTLKELIAQVPRATGVIFQSIEECVELLVSEGRVSEEKVGVHTLFWWFPTTEAQREWKASGGCEGAVGMSGAVQRPGQSRPVNPAAEARALLLALPIDALEAACSEEAARMAQLDLDLDARQAAVGTQHDRQRDAAQQQAHLDLRNTWQQKLSSLALYDEAFVAALRDGASAALEAANRWTDNFFLLEQHISATMGRPARELRRSLNVPEELDYITPSAVTTDGEMDDAEAQRTSTVSAQAGAGLVQPAATQQSEHDADVTEAAGPQSENDNNAAQATSSTVPARQCPLKGKRSSTAGEAAGAENGSSDPCQIVGDSVAPTGAKTRKRKREKA